MVSYNSIDFPCFIGRIELSFATAYFGLCRLISVLIILFRLSFPYFGSYSGCHYFILADYHFILAIIMLFVSHYYGDPSKQLLWLQCLRLDMDSIFYYRFICFLIIALEHGTQFFIIDLYVGIWYSYYPLIL